MFFLTFVSYPITLLTLRSFFNEFTVKSHIIRWQVVRELQYSRNGVTVTTEDGSVYSADYVILSVSIGVLQSDLISFNPRLPVRLIFLFQFNVE